MAFDPNDPIFSGFADAQRRKAAAQPRGRDPVPVPETCTLDPRLRAIVEMTEPDPCAGCNMDRAVCKGRPNGPR